MYDKLILFKILQNKYNKANEIVFISKANQFFCNNTVKRIAKKF